MEIYRICTNAPPVYYKWKDRLFALGSMVLYQERLQKKLLWLLVKVATWLGKAEGNNVETMPLV